MGYDDNGPLMSNNNKGNKTRMGVILRQSFGEKSANGKEELEALRLRYHTMCKRLTTVKKALKDRHAALLNTTQARVAVRACPTNRCVVVCYHCVIVRSFFWISTD